MDLEAISTESEAMMDMDRKSDLKLHLKAIKWIAGAFMTALVVSVPAIVLLSLHSTALDRGLQIPIDSERQPNDTSCVYVKQYHLTEQVYVTVCNLNGDIVLDIRKFINDTATIKGIQLSLRQWMTLKQWTPRVDQAVSEARTYWNHLKSTRKHDG